MKDITTTGDGQMFSYFSICSLMFINWWLHNLLLCNYTSNLIFFGSWDETFQQELEVYRETKDVGDVW